MCKFAWPPNAKASLSACVVNKEFDSYLFGFFSSLPKSLKLIKAFSAAV